MTRTALLFVAPLLLVSVAACGGPGTGSGEDVAALRKEVKELRKDVEAAQKDAKRSERQLASLQDQLADVRRDMLSAPDAVVVAEPTLSDESGEAEAVAAVAGAAPEAVVEALATEEGRKAIETALAEVNRRRDEERRERWVGSMIDRFAADAQLTPEQTVQMKDIVGGSFDKIREVWSGMRDMGGATPEERAVARQEAMAKMEDIRLETDDQVKAILNSAQYDQYVESSEAMRRGFGGGRRGR